MSNSSSPAPERVWLLVTWTDGTHFASMPCAIPDGPFLEARDLKYAGCVPSVGTWERGRYPWTVVQYRLCSAPDAVSREDYEELYPSYDADRHEITYPNSGPYAYPAPTVQAEGAGLDLSDLDSTGGIEEDKSDAQ